MLEDAGFPVLQAATADAAWAILERAKEVGVLFTDIDMPGSMDAHAGHHHVREHRIEALEPFPIALQSRAAPSLCFDALSLAEPVSTSAESALRVPPRSPPAPSRPYGALPRRNRTAVPFGQAALLSLGRLLRAAIRCGSRSLPSSS
ncbi:hypothetical protein [Methylobacterium dankookense]|uniref:hypothetical protein n=1 Tax=Methylobacterium dankookense TaxID=560405 RepID=UPI0027956B68|nr:hypothetical protein [Methylobacterium dankookense]